MSSRCRTSCLRAWTPARSRPPCSHWARADPTSRASVSRRAHGRTQPLTHRGAGASAVSAQGGHAPNAHSSTAHSSIASSSSARDMARCSHEHTPSRSAQHPQKVVVTHSSSDMHAPPIGGPSTGATSSPSVDAWSPPDEAAPPRSPPQESAEAPMSTASANVSRDRIAPTCQKPEPFGQARRTVEVDVAGAGRVLRAPNELLPG